MDKDQNVNAMESLEVKNAGRLLGNSVLYGGTTMLSKFLSYLLVPLYTYNIAASSGDYGVVTNLYAYVSLLLAILTMGMETTYFRFAERKNVDRAQAFSNAGVLVGMAALVFVALVSVFLTPIANAMGYGSHREYVEIMAIIIGLDAFQSILFSKLRLDERVVRFCVLKLVFIVLSTGLNLFVFCAAPGLKKLYPQWMGWYDPNYNVGYIFIINLICTSLITLAFIPEIKQLRKGIDKALLKKMLNYAWPFILVGLAGMMNQNADKVFFRYIMPGTEGDVQLGIYGACVKLAVTMTVITSAFRYAYDPYIFGGKKDERNPKNQAAVMKYYIVFTLFAFNAVLLLLPVLKYLVKSDYWAALPVVPIVMMAEVFYGIFYNLSFWYKLDSKDRTWWGAILSGAGCVVLLAINFIFVPRYGYMACAWAIFVGQGVAMLLSYFIGRKKSEVTVPYDLKSALGYFALTGVIFIVQRWVHFDSLWATMAFNSGLLLVYAAVAYHFEKTFLVGLSKQVFRKAVNFFRRKK